MRNAGTQLKTIDETITELIDRFSGERGFLSRELLEQLRTLTEVVAVMLSGESDYSYEIFQQKGKKYISSNADFFFLSKFHESLQKTKSHFATDKDVSERLMLRYYEYLLKLRTVTHVRLGVKILTNFEKFPINTDSSLLEYYKNIAQAITTFEGKRTAKQVPYSGRFYIQKVKPFFVKGNIFYEVTFRHADNRMQKFDRHIAFTALDIFPNYAVKLSLINEYIQIGGKRMPIQLISDWETSVRFCELKNFESIFTINPRDFSPTDEYVSIMKYLTQSHRSFLDIIDLPEEEYGEFKKMIQSVSKSSRILVLLDTARRYILGNLSGSRVLRYLLLSLNNRLIKSQVSDKKNYKLSDLNLVYKCIPFDQTPFAASLVEHNPTFSDLLDCFDVDDREHELLARCVRNNAEIEGNLYSPFSEIDQFGDIEQQIERYNNDLYTGTKAQIERRLGTYKKHAYISGYENAVVDIITKLKEYSTSGVKNHASVVEEWLSSGSAHVDCNQKTEALKKMFLNARISLIYGAAGTGKTKLIEHFSSLHNSRKKLYLAYTHAAVSNLKNRVGAQNATFKTISSFLHEKNTETKYDIVIVDECSVISNLDMQKVLEKVSCVAMVLAGDIYQIESIRFGNWFYLAKDLLPHDSIVELSEPWRAKNNSDLLILWSKVRNLDEDILEYITQNKYSMRLDETLFVALSADEIILCLNYDGIYGINNINRYLQENNRSRSVSWENQNYKIGDPILFNESNRFGKVLFNNLKGKILDIELEASVIYFTLEIEKSVSEFDILQYTDLQMFDGAGSGKSVIRFPVYARENADEDAEYANASVPFNVAYAVSIHKAQGLEYDSVKVVITNQSEERVTLNIFYTAITRAKKNLRLYWTPETEKSVLSELKIKANKRDIYLLREKYLL